MSTPVVIKRKQINNSLKRMDEIAMQDPMIAAGRMGRPMIKDNLRIDPRYGQSPLSSPYLWKNAW